jgi:hypothetical protein
MHPPTAAAAQQTHNLSHLHLQNRLLLLLKLPRGATLVRSNAIFGVCFWTSVVCLALLMM